MLVGGLGVGGGEWVGGGVGWGWGGGTDEVWDIGLPTGPQARNCVIFPLLHWGKQGAY